VAGDDRRAVGESRHHLGDETRFADSGRSEDREEVARPLTHRALESALQQGALVLAADHRRVQPSRVSRRSREDFDHAERGHLLLLALDLERGDLLDTNGVAHEPLRLSPDQDLA
jgi:hypothetical protein